MSIKIQDLSTDTVAQWVEHLGDKPRTWVQILASVIFFICSVALFLSLLPWRSVGGQNSTGVCKKSPMVIHINDMQNEQNIILKIESTVDIHRKTLLT